ncbi:nucleotide sugar dehydrogenase [Kutzneria albida]|uniref:UDP-glucose/GDP-mannose dehydrogenase C-terminal domain-containing protein n=1 Tax=Kutzneria albida DSM 43870 TaxID=1449976 RepID=W5WBL8_9PSEU|nr:nucleotide sugar dehydrogenase [Kutzneria albida]AHH98573.1 hypothetical protein KALB_5211 [Kutzneria albida DSM 43870]
METFDVAVIGLGFTGLPVAVAAAEAGYLVMGVDSSPQRVADVTRGTIASKLPTVAEHDLRAVLATGRLRVQESASRLPAAGVFVLCVPTPPGSFGGADLAPLRQATDAVAACLRTGNLVLVQSTCPPGVVNQVVVPQLLERTGLRPGVDFHLAHSPVRIDPGVALSPLRSLPRVVGGLTPACTERAACFLRRLTDHVIPVSSVQAAELVKVFENTFRLVNISLVNELAMLCQATGVAAEEVLEAASSKPFGFLRHNPSAGAGGDCVPVSAGFLASAAQRQGTPAALIEAAIARNNAMPATTIRFIEDLLAVNGMRSLRGSRILVAGVTYKPDVPNIRQSAAVKVLELLHHTAYVSYHDPYVPALVLSDGTNLRSQNLQPGAADLIVLLTNHQVVAASSLMRCRAPVVDCSAGLPRLLACGQPVTDDTAC